MSASGQRLGLRLFLEGIEVPVIGASVQIGINSPATASIQVIPGDRILDLRPRTMVHLFFWDYTRDNNNLFDTSNPESVARYLGVTVDEAQEILKSHPERLTEAFDELRGYKLLYSGEVIGVSLLKSPSGRQAVLQCSDFSTYWDTTYQFFISYGPNGNFLGSSAAVWAGGASMFDDLTSGHVSVMNDYLNNTPKTPGLEKVKGLMGGIISLLEAMGGVPNHTQGVNDFFTIAELKNHILQQIVCEQNDDTSARLFDNKAFMDWMNRGMSSLGTLSTFRDMMRLLFKYIYYEVVPNPAARYVPAIKPKEITKRVVETVTVELPPKVKDRFVAMATEARRLSELITSVANPDNALKYQGGPKSALIIDPSSSTPKSVVLDEKVDDSLLLKKNNDDLVFSHRKAEQYKAEIRRLSTPSNIPAGLRPTIDQIIGWLDLVVPAGSDSSARVIAGNKRSWKNVADLFDSAVGFTTSRRRERDRRIKTGAEIDRLHTQIFRPDCFFVAPPRCNVLFPEQYTQFSFSRNFLQEVTRLRLHIGWEFGLNEGLLETEYYFAPTTKDIKALAKQQGSYSVAGLLPWEVYSGILPKFETMHEVNYIAGRNERKRKIVTNKTQGHARSYGQRVANFNYMKYRFAARTCDVSAKFNPFLVCGFPAAIIERPFVVDPGDPGDQKKLKAALQTVNKGREKTIAADDVSDHIRDVAREMGAPNQYLGMIAALGHNVDQNGGSTSFTLTHARVHRITNDDFLNIFSKELTNDIDTEVVATTLDAKELLARGDWKNLKKLIDLTDQKLGARFEELRERQTNSNNIEEDEDESAFDLASRPDGSPTGSFGSLLSPTAPQREYQIVQNNATADEPAALVGEVRKVRAAEGNGIVLEPVHPGVLHAGKKDSKGVKLLQVQVHSDAALMLTGADINKSIKPIKVRPTPPRKVPNEGPTYKNLFPGSPIYSEQDSYDYTIPSNSVFRITEVAPPKVFAGTWVKKKVADDKKNYFVWQRVTIYEERPTKKRIGKLIPVEEALRPAWFSPIYSNWFIGDEVYQPFFGCGSVVDQALFQAVDQERRVSASFGTGRREQQEMLAELDGANGDREKIALILEKAKAKNLSDVPDVESSLDALAYIYGEVRRLGLDVHKFVHDYTYRPIATMEQIFGSYDLEYKIVDDGKNKRLRLEKGIPGFHSTAIDKVAAERGELLGLIDNPDYPEARSRIAGKKEPVSRILDPRPGRRERVEQYLEEINAGSGTLGIGVQG